MSIEAAQFGTLGRDAESKISKTGKPYLRLSVACSEGDATQWVSAMVFDERAVAVADKLVKGARVYLEGRLSLHEWTASDGTTRAGLSVFSWHCRLAKSAAPKPNPKSRSLRHSLLVVLTTSQTRFRFEAGHHDNDRAAPRNTGGDG